MEELPELEGWLTLPEAASDLQISRQRFYQMVQEGKITTCRRLGRRPIYIVREQEIQELLADKIAATEATFLALKSGVSEDSDEEGELAVPAYDPSETFQAAV
jgi:excisionase family DNA binding protein